MEDAPQAGLPLSAGIQTPKERHGSVSVWEPSEALAWLLDPHKGSGTRISPDTSIKPRAVLRTPQGATHTSAYLPWSSKSKTCGCGTILVLAAVVHWKVPPGLHQESQLATKRHHRHTSTSE